MSSGFDRAQQAYDTMLPPDNDHCEECGVLSDDHCEDCEACDCDGSCGTYPPSYEGCTV